MNTNSYKTTLSVYIYVESGATIVHPRSSHVTGSRTILVKISIENSSRNETLAPDQSLYGARTSLWELKTYIQKTPGSMEEMRWPLSEHIREESIHIKVPPRSWNHREATGLGPSWPPAISNHTWVPLSGLPEISVFSVLVGYTLNDRSSHLKVRYNVRITYLFSICRSPQVEAPQVHRITE